MPAGQGAEIEQEVDDPDDDQPDVRVPFRLGMLLGLGDAEEIGGRGENAEQVVAEQDGNLAEQLGRRAEDDAEFADNLRSWLASSPAETFDPSTVETPPSGLRVITRGPGPSTPDGSRAEPVNVVGLSASAQEPWRPNGSIGWRLVYTILVGSRLPWTFSGIYVINQLDGAVKERGRTCASCNDVPVDRRISKRRSLRTW